jgi:hypothetical protein
MLHPGFAYEPFGLFHPQFGQVLDKGGAEVFGKSRLR